MKMGNGEVDGALEVCVVLDGFIDREVTVNLSTVNGTAIGIICIQHQVRKRSLLNLWSLYFMYFYHIYHVFLSYL